MKGRVISHCGTLAATNLRRAAVLFLMLLLWRDNGGLVTAESRLAPLAHPDQSRQEELDTIHNRPSILAPSSTVDLAVRDFGLTQGVADEPLVLNKAAAARVTIALPSNASLDAEIRVDVNGEVLRTVARLDGPAADVMLGIEPPRRVAPITAKVSVIPLGGIIDPNPDDNVRSVTVQTVETTEQVNAFFLPVDWTPNEQSTYDYASLMPQFVRDAGEFLRGTYPLPADSITVAYSMTPYMPSSFEKALTDSQGKFNFRNAVALYGSLSIAGRRYRPDATMIVGVLPPNWFRRHGQPGTLGLTLTDVKGIVTGQYESDLPPTIAAHEIGHLYALEDDYDFAIKPARPCFAIPAPGVWVQQQQNVAAGLGKSLCTFMSSSSSRYSYWTDASTYEYLLAKFALNRGSASAPLIVAANMTRKLEPDGQPGKASANRRRFEPNQSVYVSAAGMALLPNSKITVRLYKGNALIKTLAPQTTSAGSRWYAFFVAGSNTLSEGNYSVKVYLDGQLAKTNQFEVRAAP